MNNIYVADIAARGILLGGVAQAFFMPVFVYFAGWGWLPGGANKSSEFFCLSFVVFFMLAIRPIIMLRPNVCCIDPFEGVDGVRARLHGRIFGSLLGLPIGYFLVKYMVW